MTESTEIIQDEPAKAVLNADLVVVNLPLSSLRLNPRNARKHNDKHIDQIALSIESFRYNAPILIDSHNMILSGEGRFRACRKLGWKTIPTIQLMHLTEKQAAAYALAENRIAENSVWSEKMLAENLKELRSAGLDFNIEATGFSLDEIDFQIEALDVTLDESDPDDQLPDMVEEPAVSVIGDEWLLGDNRLLHGDATKLADVERLMNGKRAAMCFTDPPYNVDYGSSAKDRLRGVHRPILNDNLGDGFGDFLLAFCSNILALTDGGIYICMSSSALHILQSAFARAGGHWSTFIIWAKQTFTLGRADYQRQYEPILYGWREGVERHWCGARDQGDVWFVNKPVKNDLHPTMKPVELVMRALRNSSKRGDIVLDLFLGSGSTLIAAERAGRVCYGMELDPRHVDTAIRRWQRHTGGDALHAATGKKFSEIATERKISHVE